MRYAFEPRWKEELVCSCDAGRLVFNMTMGLWSISFPTEARWSEQAPLWARSRYREILEALQAWATSGSIPLEIDARASVYADRLAAR